MVRTFGAAVSAISLLVGSATAGLAADLPSRQAPPVYVPPPPIPVFSWTGPYLGLQLGYEFGRDTFAADGVFGPLNISQNGIIGGAHAGYLYQMGQFVVGIEGDVNGSSYRGSIVNPFNGVAVSSRIPVDGSIRGRVGYAVDRALFYATGGAAFASIDNTYAGRNLSQESHFGVGYTVGGGVEYAFTPNWSMRAEYRFTDYGKYSEFPSSAVVIPRTHHEIDNRVQVGISYKFGDIFASPVVARY